MKEVSRLSAAVAKLRARSERRSRHGRALSGADPQGLIEAVLEEIDETVLARELQLRNERGEEICLEVSGRRLLRVAGVAPRDLADSREAVVGKPIADADGIPSRALAELLAAMAAGSPSFTVVSRKLSRRPDPAETGCSPEALRFAWNRLEARPGRDRPPTVAEFTARAAPLATALIRVEDGEVVQQAGSEQTIARLTHLAPSHAPGGRPQSGGQGSGDLVVLGGATEGNAILCARDSSQTLLLMFPARLTEALIAQWTGNARVPPTP